jgi:hypothetical protein
MGMDKAAILIWVTTQLDAGNLHAFAERLGVSIDDLKAAGRVLRAVY